MKDDHGYIEGAQDAKIDALGKRVDELAAAIEKNSTLMRRDFHAMIDPLRKALIGNGSDGGMLAKVAWHDKLLKWALSATAATAAAAFVRAFFR